MKILSTRRFALWWQLAMDWFQRQFAAIAASIDFTTVNNKIDAVGGKVDAVSDKIDNIDIDTTDLAKDATVAKDSTVAKEATLGTSSDTSVSTTIFGWLKSIRDFLVGIVSTSPYAKETTAQQAASDAAAAKTAAQTITGYALQGSDTTATNTAILEAINAISGLKVLYSARFEQNQDGQDTYTMVMPVVAGVEESESGHSVTVTM